MNAPSSEQQYVIDQLKGGNHVIVDACAGSGKTTTIMACAMACPKQLFAMITYNKQLRVEVETKVKELGLTNIHVYNYHSIAKKYYSNDGHTDTGIRDLLRQQSKPFYDIPLYSIIVIDEAQDMTFATDNFEAGLLIGKWARAKMGDAAKDAKIGMLDINKDNISVDVARDTGFLVGFGIDVPNLNVMGSETDSRVIGHESSLANPEGGVTSVENLLAKEPGMNVVYTINEPAAEGAYQALKKAGKEKDVLIVSVDGGCPGVASVKSGVIGATSQQYPLLMASKGIEAIATFAKDGTKPSASDGLTFFNTGVNLVTDSPADGVPSIDSTKGTELCWG